MQKWILNSAKAIGLSHIETNRPCQDNVKTLYSNNVNVAILSDGCGSSYFSEIGSRLIVDKVSEYLAQNFDELYQKDDEFIKKAIVNFILENVEKFVETNINFINNYFNSDIGKRNYQKVLSYKIMNYLLDEDKKKLLHATLFDATLLFFAIKEEKCLVGHCGDGFILGNRKGDFEVLSEELKLGEKNETNYPSSIYYFAKINDDDNQWNLFRVQKINSNDYLGFILMSDGAEKPLIATTNNISTPRKNNCNVLFDILCHETEEDAAKYLEDLLVHAYREVENNNGELIEITDDDVSVAIVVASNYSTEIFEDENSSDVVKDYENSSLNLLNNSETNNDIQKMFYTKKLLKLLTKKNTLDVDKFEWLNEIFIYSIKQYKEKSFTNEEYVLMLKEKFKSINKTNIDNEDIKLVYFYGKKCGIFKLFPTFKIICKDGDLNYS